MLHPKETNLPQNKIIQSYKNILAHTWWTGTTRCLTAQFSLDGSKSPFIHLFPIQLNACRNAIIKSNDLNIFVWNENRCLMSAVVLGDGSYLLLTQHLQKWRVDSPDKAGQCSHSWNIIILFHVVNHVTVSPFKTFTYIFLIHILKHD